LSSIQTKTADAIIEETLNKLPLDLIIPKRRPAHAKKGSSPKANKHSKTNFAILNQVLQEFQKGTSQEKMFWENPAFKDLKNGGEIPFYNIFGQKNKGKGKHGKAN